MEKRIAEITKNSREKIVVGLSEFTKDDKTYDMVRRFGLRHGTIILLQKLHHFYPHDWAARIHVAVRIADQLGIGAKFEAVEHNAACLRHRRSHGHDVNLETLERRADQNGVVDWRAYLDPALGCQTAREAENSRAVA